VRLVDRHLLAAAIDAEIGPAGVFDRPRTPEEIMDELDCVLGLTT
jgi:hypothetical protein